MSQFENLSDHDFELLVADLLGADLDTRFETFPRGRDSGIDLRSRTADGLHLVQCKHYERSDFRTLKRSVAGEVAKIAALDEPPDRYTLVTSRRLTPHNKQALIEVLQPYVRDERDVLGAEDLDALLRLHPAIRRANVKLYLGSLEPLRHVLSADVHARTRALVEDVRATLPRYVQTRSLQDALQLLEAHRTVIVAGPPGVGKTTLARLLLLESAEQGYVPYSVQADIAEAWRLLDDEEPQVFFFDDFLGRTSLFDGVSTDARDLAAFIKNVRQRPQRTRLILATREYVLQRARNEVEDLRWTALDADKYALTLDRYTRVERARIFYNHIYFSPDVDEVARRDLLAMHGRRPGYMEIIDHPSYSPRLVEWMTGLSGYSLGPADRRAYTEFCVNVLDHPDDLWTHAYERGLTDAAQRLLLLLPGFSSAIEVDELERAFSAAARQAGVPSSQRQFDEALKVLMDSFVRSIDDPTGRISALNPSLIDFLRRRLLEDPEILVDGVAAATSLEQADALHRIWAESSRPSPERMADALAAAAVWLELGNLWDRMWALTHWIREHPALVGRLQSAVTAVERDLVAEIPEEDAGTIIEYAELLDYWRIAGLPVDAVADAIKARGLGQLPTPWEFFQALHIVRHVAPDRFSAQEWAGVIEQLTAFAREALADSPDHFDDDQDLYTFLQLLKELDVPIGHERLEEAEQRMEAHLYAYMTLPGQVAASTETRSAYRDEDAEIRSIFGGFSD